MSIGTSELLAEEAAAPFSIELSASGEITARSPLQLFWRRFRADRVAMVSLGFIVVLILVAIFAPLVVKLVGVSGPNTQNLNSLDLFGQPLGPSSAHPTSSRGPSTAHGSRSRSPSSPPASPCS
jgi:hypothetical protein